MEKHQTYIINLKERPDRLVHAQMEFKNKNEFKLNFIISARRKNGALGLWVNFVKIIRRAVKLRAKYVIICEDDHLFTSHYDEKGLFEAIQEADQNQADVLMGGVSWFSDALQISKSLFWVDEFTGTQFVIVYEKFFNKILQADFLKGDTADKLIGELTKNKFFVHPFISVQKEFGYSDATAKNNIDGYVEQIFNDTSQMVEHLNTVASFYQIRL